MKIKHTFYVHRNDCNGNLLLFNGDMADDYFTYLGTVDIEGDFNMPSEKEIKRRKIDSLTTKMKEVRANAQLKVEVLEEKIQKLMALEVE